MHLAREGIREMIVGTVVLAALTTGAVWLYWPVAVVPIVVWVWVISFFRDPCRKRSFGAGQLCSPADGRVTEISHLDHCEAVGGPALRIGIFLSIFDVHANRSPCAGRVRSIRYQKGRFFDARDPRSGAENEANTLVLDPDPPVAGPVIVRQVAGKVARRIVCHTREGDVLRTGQRFGMIKFGSRTELILPAGESTDIHVTVGQKVRAGLTLVATQRSPAVEEDRACHCQAGQLI